MAEKLSEHFTLDEMTYSATAKANRISNIPVGTHKKVLQHTCIYLLEPLRALLNDKYKEYGGKRVKCVSLRITSGYRGPALNKAVGGVSTSEHCLGQAADCEAVLVFMDGVKKVLPYTELYESIKAWVKEGRFSVNQCIQEKSGSAVWVHVSHHAAGRTKDKREFLKYDGRTYRLDVRLP